jgi:hypothetical protein
VPFPAPTLPGCSCAAHNDARNTAVHPEPSAVVPRFVALATYSNGLLAQRNPESTNVVVASLPERTRDIINMR